MSDQHDTTDQDLSSLQGVFPPYVSPTLQLLPAARRPNPSTICEACPASIWYSEPDSVTAYCRLMHLKSWSSEEPKAMQSCDGQIAAELERIDNLTK